MLKKVLYIIQLFFIYKQKSPQLKVAGIMNLILIN
jgi:hypothetical protein